MAVTKSAGTWVYEDLFSLPEGKRYEIIKGELYEMPAPTPDHQRVIGRLYLRMTPAAASIGADVLLSPLDVFVPGSDPVQPDLLVLLPEKRHLVSGRGVEGVPDLVVEVLSPSNRPHDLATKRALYERGGVREYWIVDRDAATIEVLVLEGGSYRRRVLAAGSDLVTSAVLPTLSFPAAAAFQG